MNENDINQEQTEVKDQAQSASVQTDDSHAGDTRADNLQAKPNKLKNRLICMLVLAVSSGIAGSVLIALIIGQTIFRLFAKESNEAMKKLANQLTDYIYKTLNYLSFNSEERPFPYQVWDEKKEDLIISTDNAEPST